MKPEEYENNQITQAIAPASDPLNYPPETDAMSWTNRASKATAPTFDGNDGNAELHQTAVHQIKQQAGANLGNMQGGADDLDAIYQAVARGSTGYDGPNYDADVHGIFSEVVAGRPAAQAKLDEAMADKLRESEQGITPEMKQLRGQLPVEGRAEFDARLSQERLDKLFPPPVEPVPAGANIGDVAQNTQVLAPTQVRPAPGVDIRPVSDSEAAKDQFTQERDAKRISQAIDTLGLDPADPASQTRASEFNQMLKEQEVSSLHFLGKQNKILGDPSSAKTYNNLSDTGKIAFIKHRDALDKISTRSSGYGKRSGEKDRSGNEGPEVLTDEGKRMEALRGIESRVAAGEFTYDDLAENNVFSPDKDSHALNIENLDGMVKGMDTPQATIEELIGPDGNPYKVLMQPSGSASMVGSDKDKPMVDGVYPMKGGGVAQMFNGKMTTYKPGEAAMGMNGNVYPNDGEYSTVPDGTKSVSDAVNDLKLLPDLKPLDIERMKWILANQFDPQARELIDLMNSRK